MTLQLDKLKLNLARVFDDNLHTQQWHNIVDSIIIFIILLSTAEIFISTFDIDPQLRRILWWVDVITLIFFTIEVALRIWVAPVINPKYNGLKGRIKYCFTFYGALDILSTFPGACGADYAYRPLLQVFRNSHQCYKGKEEGTDSLHAVPDNHYYNPKPHTVFCRA